MHCRERRGERHRADAARNRARGEKKNAPGVPVFGDLQVLDPPAERAVHPIGKKPDARHGGEAQLQTDARTGGGIEKEQQGKRLQALESRDGEKWRKLMGYIATALTSGAVTLLLSRLIV